MIFCSASLLLYFHIFRNSPYITFIVREKVSIKLCVGEKARTKHGKILTVVMTALEMVGGGGSFSGFYVW